MARKTQYRRLTSCEKIDGINKENIYLRDEFLKYMKATKHAESTISVYKNDLDIFFVWNEEYNQNKKFVDVTKRDFTNFQIWLMEENGNSPARVRRIKATISSMSNFIENILDEEKEYSGFKSNIKKVASPPNSPTRKKTVYSDEQLEYLLEELVNREMYDKACIVALGMCSGRRKAELLRYKVSYFDDSNLIYGGLYKTPEPVKTKGRGDGKYIYLYTLSEKFKPYFDLWMKYRVDNGIESEWLFPSRDNPSEHMNKTSINHWMNLFSRITHTDFYFHALRHYFTTNLARMGFPESVIQDIIGWDSADMCRLYTDIEIDEKLDKYFGDFQTGKQGDNK